MSKSNAIVDGFKFVIEPIKVWLWNWATLLALSVIGTLIVVPLSYGLYMTLNTTNIVPNPTQVTLWVMAGFLYLSVGYIGYRVIDWPWQSTD